NTPNTGPSPSPPRDTRTAINKHLIFSDLEWVKRPDGPGQALLARPELGRYRHYLERKRAWRPHYLSEPEEKILEEKSLTGRAAFVRLFDESVAVIRFPFEHAGQRQELSLQDLNKHLYDPDRTVREAAARAWTTGLKDNARLLTFVFNTLVLDHHSDCTLRKFPDPAAPRNLDNEISAEVVEALMTACERYHPTVQRYYHLKA